MLFSELFSEEPGGAGGGAAELTEEGKLWSELFSEEPGAGGAAELTEQAEPSDKVSCSQVSDKVACSQVDKQSGSELKGENKEKSEQETGGEAPALKSTFAQRMRKSMREAKKRKAEKARALQLVELGAISEMAAAVEQEERKKEAERAKVPWFPRGRLSQESYTKEGERQAEAVADAELVADLKRKAAGEKKEEQQRLKEELAELKSQVQEEASQEQGKKKQMRLTLLC